MSFRVTEDGPAHAEQISPVSGMLSRALLLVELPGKLRNAEDPQASDCDEARWPWADPLASPGLSFIICKVGTRCLPIFYLGHFCDPWKLLPS